ncbi:MAG TPA: hypothetical protein VFV64_08185, partial [Permianibacter sp.]|nr:hypothetical protein [Permianibacter sp.]
MNSQVASTKLPRLHPITANLRRTTTGDAPLIKRRRYYLYSFDANNGWLPNSLVPCVDLENGQLYVNGTQIVKPQIAHDHVAWLQ